MQTKLSIISNILFKYILLFLVSFLWLKTYFNNKITVIISIMIALTIGQLIYLVLRKRKNIIALNIKEQKHLQEISLKFRLVDEKTILNFYYTILSTSLPVFKEKNYLTWEDSIFIPIYYKSEIDSNIISDIFKKHKNYKTIIIAGISFSPDAQELAKTLSPIIHCLDENQTYSLFKKYNSFPNFQVSLNNQKRNKLSIIKESIFLKQNFKHYFLSGIIVLISSFFIRYNIYYLIMSTILFVFSAICIFKPSKKIDSIIDKL